MKYNAVTYNTVYVWSTAAMRATPAPAGTSSCAAYQRLSFLALWLKSSLVCLMIIATNKHGIFGNSRDFGVSATVLWVTAILGKPSTTWYIDVELVGLTRPYDCIFPVRTLCLVLCRIVFGSQPISCSNARAQAFVNCVGVLAGSTYHFVEL